MSLGFAAKSISSVELNLKNPPSTGFQRKSATAFRVCLPKVFEMSSLNCHLRWKDCCGTLVLVPNSVGPGKVTKGALIVLSITLFQYWNPNVNWFTALWGRMLFTVRFAI